MPEKVFIDSIISDRGKPWGRVPPAYLLGLIPQKPFQPYYDILTLQLVQANRMGTKTGDPWLDFPLRVKLRGTGEQVTFGQGSRPASLDFGHWTLDSNSKAPPK